MSRATFNESDTTVRPPTHGAPPATEDLTIAEQLESSRVRDEHRPGEECFRRENGSKAWVTASNVRQFIREMGGQHPTDYFSATGQHWEDALFGKNPSSS